MYVKNLKCSKQTRGSTVWLDSKNLYSWKRHCLVWEHICRYANI